MRGLVRLGVVAFEVTVGRALGQDGGQARLGAVGSERETPAEAHFERILVWNETISISTDILLVSESSSKLTWLRIRKVSLE